MKSRELHKAEAPDPTVLDSVPAVNSWTLEKESDHDYYSICQGLSSLENNNNANICGVL